MKNILLIINCIFISFSVQASPSSYCSDPQHLAQLALMNSALNENREIIKDIKYQIEQKAEANHRLNKLLNQANTRIFELEGIVKDLLARKNEYKKHYFNAKDKLYSIKDSSNDQNALKIKMLENALQERDKIITGMNLSLQNLSKEINFHKNRSELLEAQLKEKQPKQNIEKGECIICLEDFPSNVLKGCPAKTPNCQAKYCKTCLTRLIKIGKDLSCSNCRKPMAPKIIERYKNR